MGLTQQFDDQSLRRISNAVRRIEKMPQQFGGINSSNPTSDDDWLWAEITDNDVSSTLTGGDSIAYDWKKVIPDGSGGFTDDPSSITGSANAREINRIFTPTGYVVRLYFVGFDGSDDYVWEFSVGSTIRLRGVADSTITAGSSGTVSLFDYDDSSGGGSYSDSGIDVDAFHDWGTDDNDVLPGAEVEVAYDVAGSRWLIVDPNASFDLCTDLQTLDGYSGEANRACKKSCVS